MRIAIIINKLWEVCQAFSVMALLIFYQTEYYNESLINRMILFYYLYK